MTRGEWIVCAVLGCALAALVGDGIGYRRAKAEQVAKLKPLIVVQDGSEPWPDQAKRSCKERYFVCQKQQAMEAIRAK